MTSIVTRQLANALVKSTPPEEGKAKTYTFKLSDGDLDRYNDRLKVDGWKLDNFNANPVIFYNHDSGIGWFSDPKSLPIGKGHAYKSGGALYLDVQFDPNDEFARKVASKVEGGFLNAVSVGYRMTEGKYRENEKHGWDSDEQELLEASVVTIPGNERALRVRSGPDDDFFDHLAKALTRAQAKATPTPGVSPENNAVQENEMTTEQIKALALEAAKQGAAEAVVAMKAEQQKAADEAQAKIVEAAKGNREAMTPALTEVKAERAPITGRPVVEGHKGMTLARFIQAKALAKLDGRDIRETLKGLGDEILVKALAQNTFTGFGSTVHEVVSTDFIELLRNETVVRKAGPRQISLKGGSLKFDRQTGAASASYGNEGTSIQAGSEPASDQLTMSEKKLTALIPFSNDLLRNSSVGAQEMIRADLVKVVALKEDEQFLFGLGSVGAPRGLYFQIHSDHRYGMTALTTAGTPTVLEAKKEFNKALKKMKIANARMSKFAWLFNPNVETAVLDAIGPGGEGYNSLEREMMERAQVRSKPFYVTNQIPNTLTSTAVTGGTKTAILGLDFDEVIIADWLDLELEVVPNGTYKNASGTVISGLSEDQTVIRAISKHDIAMRHSKSGVAAYDITWGV